MSLNVNPKKVVEAADWLIIAISIKMMGLVLIQDNTLFDAAKKFTT